jgi:hypothetical protein
MCATCPVHLNLLDIITLILFSETCIYLFVYFMYGLLDDSASRLACSVELQDD